MIYFTSDLHFNHDRDFIYGPRGFKTVAEMNETLIKKWNETVSKEDEIYVLGDFFLGADQGFIKETLDTLNGRIHLIVGNHDSAAKIKLYKSEAERIDEVVDAKRLKYGDRLFFLCHYPVITSEFDYEASKVIINLFGHTHSPEKFYENRPYMYNVAVDAHDNGPVSIETILEDFNAKVSESASLHDAESSSSEK